MQSGGSKQTDDAVAEQATVSHGEVGSTVKIGDDVTSSVRRCAVSAASLEEELAAFLDVTQLSISPSQEFELVTT